MESSPASQGDSMENEGEEEGINSWKQGKELEVLVSTVG